ncbi:tape measure protein [Pseudomonas sp. S9]|uniref:tape measure protein n=1 Tax=Pseudomonas sp. S9 TaxID=686578 RepID=UPI00025572EC|nr:tape measure protein [Pseudomonas sp. S9]
MSEQVIAQLVATLGFKVDQSGLIAFERRLQNLKSQASKFHQNVQKSLGAAPAVANSKQLVSQQKTALQLQGANLRNLVTQERLTAAQFKTRLENSKLTLATQTAEHRQAVNLLRLDRERQMLQRSGLQTSIAQHRLAQAALRTRQLEFRTQQAASRVRSNVHQSHSYRTAQNLSNSLRHSLPAGAIGGAAFGALDALGGAVNPVVLAFGGLLAATILLQRKFSELAMVDVKNSDARNIERAQLSVLTDDNKPAAAIIEKHISSLADRLGLERAQVSQPYVKSAITLKDTGIDLVSTNKVLTSILSFARGSGVDQDGIKGALRAIGQMASKGQVYAEEFKSQFAEHIPGAQRLGVQAWADVSKSGLEGTDASRDFGKSMKDGDINGDVMNRFLIRLGELMGAEANRGGRLDQISKSAESSEARLKNQQLERSIRTTEFENSKLKAASENLFIAKTHFQTSLEGLVPAFSSLETTSLKLDTAFFNLAGGLLDFTASLKQNDTLNDILTLTGGVVETMFTLLKNAIQFIVLKVVNAWMPDTSQIEALGDVFDSLLDVLYGVINKIRSLVGLDEISRVKDAPQPVPMSERPARPSPLKLVVDNDNLKRKPDDLAPEQPALLGLPSLVSNLGEKVSTLVAEKSTLAGNMAAFQAPAQPLPLTVPSNKTVNSTVSFGDINITSNSADPRALALEVQAAMRAEMDDHFQRSFSGALASASAGRIREQ